MTKPSTALILRLTLLLLLLRLSRDLLFGWGILGLSSRRGFPVFLLLGWDNNRKLLFFIVVRTVLGRI